MSEIRFSSKEHEKFMISLRELTVVEYYLDILLFGDRADNSCMLRPDLERSLLTILNGSRKNSRYYKVPDTIKFD